MKNYIHNSISSAALLLLVFSFGCTDFIDEELSKAQIILVAPADSVRSENYTQRFVWDELEGADEYQVRVVRPGFFYIEELLVDSTIERTNFNFNLTPGAYQWGVRGKNESSETPWSIHTIIIDSSLNLSGVIPQLLSPVDQFITNDSVMTFQWASLLNADEYRLKLVKGNSLESAIPLVDETIAGLSYSFTIPSDGNYVWGVQARNSLSFSQFAERSLSLDRTAPQQPVIQQPTNNAIVSSPFEVAWTSGQENSFDTVLLSGDIGFSSILSKTGSDSLSSSITASQGMKYVKVTRTDMAGNNSESEVLTLSVQ